MKHIFMLWKVLMVCLLLANPLASYADFQPSYSTAGFYSLPNTGRTVYDMNPAWRFYKGKIEGAEQKNFDDKKRSLPVSHGPTGIFLFIAVVFPSCCLLVYRYLANMSSRYLHSLTYHYSNNISCYNIRSLVYHYPKNVSCQYLHGLTCHNPSNIGENPGLPPDCHLLCLLLALTIHVYI